MADLCRMLVFQKKFFCFPKDSCGLLSGSYGFPSLSHGFPKGNCFYLWTPMDFRRDHADFLK
eukprot:6026639-Pyramimonas_sp.AAC.1